MGQSLRAIYANPIITRMLNEDTALVISFDEITEGQIAMRYNGHNVQRAIVEILGIRPARGQGGDDIPNVYKVRLSN